MPRCQGTPLNDCPYNKCDDTVIDLFDSFVCPKCAKVRYPPTTKETSNTSNASTNNTRRNTRSQGDVNESDGDSEPRSAPHGRQMVIIEPLLSYIWYSMQSGTQESVKLAVVAHFTVEQIAAAKDILWVNCDNTIIGEKQRRRDTVSRNVREAHVTDIMTALTKLSRSDNLPTLAIDALNLKLIPRSRPEELNNISLVDRLNKLEGMINSLQDITDRIMCENMTIKEKLENKPSSYADALMSTSDAPPVIHAIEPEKPNLGRRETGTTRPPTLAPVNPASTSRRGRGQSTRARGRGYSGRGGWTHNPASELRNRPGSTGRSANNLQVPTYANYNPYSVLANEGNDSFTSEIITPDDDGFTLQKKRNRKNRLAVTGKSSSPSQNFKGAPEPSRDLFIYRVETSANVELLKSYLVSKSINVRELKCVSHDDAKFKSFRLSVPASEYRSLFNESLWPNGVCVRRFIPPKKV